MAERYFYFDSEHAISVHDWIIEQSGGRFGIENIELLKSPLAMVRHDDYYPDLGSKLTHLFFSINKNHAFTDGNKRSSIALSAYFLRLNGFEHVVKRFVLETENIAVLVADNFIDKATLEEILCSLIFEEDYSEALKLKLISAYAAYVAANSKSQE